jgi:anti-sigma regulatory factor (Ser/Thr protein kinase)
VTASRKSRSSADFKAAPPASIEVTERALPGAVPAIRHRARDFARAHGADAEGVEDVALAVSEAVTNAVKYAYEPGTSGVVGLRATVADGFLEIQVIDQGLGFRDHGSGGLGLGLSLIAELSAELDISQDRKGTELRMRFLLRGGG